jgi:hypothetical protein
MAADNNLYVMVHTASDYLSSEQLETEFVSLFILGDVMNYVYIVKVEAIHGPLFVFKNYCSSAEKCYQIILYFATKEMGAIL